MGYYKMGILPNCFLLLLVLVIGVFGDDNVGSRHPVDSKQAETELEAVSKDIETGKLYFTGTGYTVNLIPHAIILGLLTFAIIFLYGDSLFGTDADFSTSGYGAPTDTYGAPAASYGAPEASYGAPAPSYGAPSYAANRYYDPYTADAASALVGDPYNPELNPYNIQPEATAAGAGK